MPQYEPDPYAHLQLIISRDENDLEGLSIDDLLASVRGWASLTDIAIASSIEGRFDARPRVVRRHRGHYRVIHLGPGSIKVDILLFFVAAAGSGLIGNAAHDIAKSNYKKAWRLLREFIKEFLGAKRHANTQVDLEQVIADFLVRANMGMDASYYSESISEAGTQLMFATTSLSREGASLVFRDTKQGGQVALDYSDRRIIETPLPPANREINEGEYDAYVVVTRYNIETGSCSVDLVGEDGATREQNFFADVIDPRFGDPMNSYVMSMAQKSPLLVRVREEDRGGHKPHLLILGLAPPIQDGLF